jgi:chorismate lyase/3-hydroxybenzoate synthase
VELEFNFNQQKSWLESHPGKLAVGLQNKLLAGSGTEVWSLPGAGGVCQQGNLTYHQADHGVCGVGVLDVSDKTLQSASESLYRQILDVCEGFEIHRFWNFVPGINQRVGELDRYMVFCTGRADAFDTHAEPVAGQSLSPASAVGTPGDQLWVMFLAGTDPLTTVENPMQIPAYQYPSRYGPRAPSFARGGLIEARRTLFISGTASIRASESKHSGDVFSQAELALENMGCVAESAGMPGAGVFDGGCARIVRIYLREPETWPALASLFEERLLHGAEQFNVIQAEICRPELLVEIEVHAIDQLVGDRLAAKQQPA